jgi:hypothetical protein
MTQAQGTGKIELTINHHHSSTEGYNLKHIHGLDGATFSSYRAGLDAVRDAMGDALVAVDHGNGYAFYAPGDPDIGSDEQTRAVAYLTEVEERTEVER